MYVFVGRLFVSVGTCTPHVCVYIDCWFVLVYTCAVCVCESECLGALILSAYV